MIVGASPRLRQIVLEVWRPLTILFVWDVAVTAFHFLSPLREPPLPTASTVLTPDQITSGGAAAVTKANDTQLDAAVKALGS